MRYRDPAGRIRHQCGATGLSLIILMVAMAAFLTLTVDTGRLFMEKRRLQQQADLAALSLGRYGCYIDGVTDKEDLEDVVRTNLADNGFDVSENNLQIAFGTASIVDNQWHASVQENNQSDPIQDVAQVNLSKVVPASFFSPSDTVPLAASASILKRAQVGFGVGSKLASVDTNRAIVARGLLNFVLESLGATGEIDLVSYEGLTNANVKLGNVVNALSTMGVIDDSGSMSQQLEQLLETPLTIGNLVSAVENSTDIIGPELSALDTLINEVSEQSVLMSDFLNVSTDAELLMALTTNVSVYDLISVAIMASADVLDKNMLVSDAWLDTSLGVFDFVSLTIMLKITEPPQFDFAVFPAQDGAVPSVKTAQIQLNISVDLLGSDDSGLDLGIVKLNSSGIGVNIEAAEAEVRLQDVRGCNWNESETVGFDFAVKPSLATVKLGDKSDATSSFTLNAEVGVSGLASVPVGIQVAPVVLGVGSCGGYIEKSGTLIAEESLPQIVLTASATDNDPAGPSCGMSGLLEEMVFDIDENALSSEIGNEVNESQDDNTLSGLLGAIGEVIDEVINIDGVVSLVASTSMPLLVDTVINPLFVDVINPLLIDFGITLGQADVFVSSFEIEGGNLMK